MELDLRSPPGFWWWFLLSSLSQRLRPRPRWCAPILRKLSTRARSWLPIRRSTGTGHRGRHDYLRRGELGR